MRAPGGRRERGRGARVDADHRRVRFAQRVEQRLGVGGEGARVAAVRGPGGGAQAAQVRGDDLSDPACATRRLLDRIGTEWTSMVVKVLAEADPDEVRFADLRERAEAHMPEADRVRRGNACLDADGKV